MAAPGGGGGEHEAQHHIFFEPRAKQRLFSDSVWPGLATHGSGGSPPLKDVSRPGGSVRTFPGVEATVGPCAVQTSPDIREVVDATELTAFGDRICLALVKWENSNSSGTSYYWEVHECDTIGQAYATVGVDFSFETVRTEEGLQAMRDQWADYLSQYVDGQGYTTYPCPREYHVCYAWRAPGGESAVVNRAARAYAGSDVSVDGVGSVGGYLWSPPEMAEFHLPHGLNLESGIVHDVGQGTVYDVPAMSDTTRRVIRLATVNGYALIGVTAPRWSNETYALLTSIATSTSGETWTDHDEHLVVCNCVYIAQPIVREYAWTDSWGRPQTSVYVDHMQTLGWYLAGDPNTGDPYKLDSDGNQVGGTPVQVGLSGAYECHSEFHGTKAYGDDTDMYDSFERLFYPYGLEFPGQPLFSVGSGGQIVEFPDRRYDKSYDWEREFRRT